MNKKIKFTAFVAGLVLIALLFAACGIDPPDEYVIDTDSVNSITKVVGQRKLAEEYSNDTDTMKSLVYRYTGIPSVQKDLMQYADFLRNDAGFISLKGTDLTQTPGYAQFGRQSNEEGKVFVITIAFRDKSYDIQVDKADGTINSATADANSGAVDANAGGDVADANASDAAGESADAPSAT